MKEIGTAMHYGATVKIFQFAEDLRKNPTESESIMWDILKSEAYVEYRFRRQHPISKFIADFYSHKLRMVIEIDGGYHLRHEQREYDSFRDSDMKEFGISVIRFSDNDVINNSSLVTERLSHFINKNSDG